MQKCFHSEGDLAACAFNKQASNANRSIDTTTRSEASAKKLVNDECANGDETTSGERLKEDDEAEMEYAATDDPFDDRLPWFQPIGR